MSETEHCLTCGYTKQDASIHLDHDLCPNKNPPWKKTGATHVNIPQTYLDKLEEQNLQLLNDKAFTVKQLDPVLTATMNAARDMRQAGLPNGQISGAHLILGRLLARLQTTDKDPAP